MSAFRISARNGAPQAAVIFFHGLGDTGNGWSFLGELCRKTAEFDHINFVFPNAPTIPITANGSYRMPGWFDILEFRNTTRIDNEGYTKALDVVDTFIEEQIELGLKPENIIVGGFSQGGGLAVGTLVKSSKKLAGIVTLSPYAPFQELFRKWNTGTVNRDTPIFHGHGRSDPMIAIAFSDLHHKFFTTELDYPDYTYKTYPGIGHSTSNDELEDVLEFIRKTVPKK